MQIYVSQIFNRYMNHSNFSKAYIREKMSLLLFFSSDADLKNYSRYEIATRRVALPHTRSLESSRAPGNLSAVRPKHWCGEDVKSARSERVISLIVGSTIDSVRQRTVLDSEMKH